MAAPAEYLDVKDLNDAQSGGLIKQDVLDQIFNNTKDFPTPFLDLAGDGGSVKNTYAEWTEDENPEPGDSSVVSGADVGSENDASLGTRSGNRTQINRKVVKITTAGEEVDSIGGSGKIGYQTAMRLIDLRRDVEHAAVSNQGSVTDDNNVTPGKTGGFSACIKTNSYSGATGSAGGFNNSTKQIDEPAQGEGRALTWEMIRDAIEDLYIGGSSRPTTVMSRPEITKRLGDYLATTNKKAQITQNVSNGPSDLVANDFYDVFRTDFGFTMKIVPNRLQPTYAEDTATDLADVLLIDPEYVQIAYLYGYRVDPLAKLGLSERKQVHVQWMVKVLLEKAHAVIRDIIIDEAVAAGT